MNRSIQVGLKRLFILLQCVLVVSLTACGGGGDGGSNGGSSGGGATLQNPSTAVIQSNMAVNYTNEQFSVGTAIQGCFRAYGGGGQSIICSVNAKESSVQRFLNTILANIQSLRGTSTIDNAAVAAMLSSYQAMDIAWLNANSLAPTYTMSAGELASVTPDYDATVNAAYSNMSLQFGTINNATIQANMDINSAYEQFTVSNAIQGCFRTYGGGGQSIICSVNAKELAVQSFLNTIVTNLQAANSVTVIDKTAVAAMLSAYQAQDIAWLNANSLAPTYTMSAGELASVTPNYDVSINSSYSNAALQVSAM